MIRPIICGLCLLLSPLASFADNPVIITQGGVYSGCWSSENPNVPAVTVQTAQTVEIVYSHISSRGNGIVCTVPMNNLIVHDCHLVAENSQVYGVQNGFGIYDEYLKGAQIYRNYFRFWRTAVDFVHAGQLGSIFWIENNQILDCEGRRSNGNGNWLSDNGNGDGGAIQINSLFGVAYGDIGWNEIINHPGKSSPTDQISIYSSSGTPSAYITVHDNFVSGIFPGDSSNTGTITATGILTDGDPSGAVCWYVNILNNTVVDFTGGGVGLAYGYQCNANGNRVVSASINPWTGNLYSASYICMGISAYQADATNVFSSNLVSVNPSASGMYGDTPEGLGIWGTYINNTTLYSSPVTKEDEDEEIAFWQAKLRNNSQQVGPE